ncbi:DNA ligase 1-like [Salvia hispanica]|uniref:DNA ligase 1-like n=1 Tax=Salvia hispanica TaxID=49212 RepID=UPI0020092B53|nr:DNA ligase 1-like [Salvia hispanica]
MASPSIIEELKKHSSEFSVSDVVKWEFGNVIPFDFLANSLVALSEVDEWDSCLTNILRAVIESSPTDLLAVICLLARKVFDDNGSYRISASREVVVRAIANSSQKTKQVIKRNLKENGNDLALVAELNRPVLLRPRRPLTIGHVFLKLEVYAKDSGTEECNNYKMYILLELFNASSTFEARTLVQFLQPPWDPIPLTNLVEALARAAVYADKNIPPQDISTHLVKAVRVSKQIYKLRPRVSLFVDAIHSTGDYKDFPELIGFGPGIPVKLKQPVAVKDDLLEIYTNFNEVELVCESYIPGAVCAQIHGDGRRIDIFVNDDCVTNMYSDVGEVISRLKKPSIESFILECKMVVCEDSNCNVSVYVTDLLYLNGMSRLMDQFESRIQLFRSSFDTKTGSFELVNFKESKDLETIPSFLKDANSSLVLKRWISDSFYQPSKQPRDWFILEKDLFVRIQYDLNLIPIAAIREEDSGDAYSSFLLASYDDIKEEYEAICYIGSTLSEAEIEELSSGLCSNLINEPKASYKYSSETSSLDVWFEPSQVWEVKASLLATSSDFRACFGVVEPDKGICLCFTSFVGVKSDSSKVSTSNMVADLYKSQKHINTEEEA